MKITTQAKERIVKSFNELVCFADILDDMLEIIAEEVKPEDLYDESQLDIWAEGNDYEKKPS